MKKINRRGYGKRAVYTLLAFLFTFLCVFGQGKEVYADDERNVFSKTGYFFVDIQGADGASTHVQVNVTYPDSVINKPDENTYQVTLTMKDSGTGGDGKALKNSHGLSFFNEKGNAVKTITVDTSQGNTADITKAETKDDDKTPVGTCINENGEKRYKEKSFTVMPDIPFQYTKEAYTYVTGSSDIPVGSSRMNAEFYEWDGSGTNSLKDESWKELKGSGNQGIWHGANKARFYLQVNTSNTGARNDTLGTRHGTYTLTMQHPVLNITYDANGATSGSVNKTKRITYNKSGKLHKFADFGLARTGCEKLNGAEWNTKRHEAKENYETAEGLYREERDNLGLANVLQSMGELQSRQGQLDEAKENYETAEGLYRKERDNLGLANVLLSLGELQSRQGQLDEAKENYETAEGLYREERANLGLANVLLSMGNLQSRQGQLDEAKENYETAEGLYREERANLGLANVLKSLGDVFLEERDFLNAISIYEKALNLYDSEQDVINHGLTMSELCFANSMLGEKEKAEKLICALKRDFDRIPYKQAKDYIEERIKESDRILEKQTS